VSAPTRVPAGHGVFSGRYTTFAHQEPEFGLTDQPSPTRGGRVDPDAEKAYRIWLRPLPSAMRRTEQSMPRPTPLWQH